MEGEGREMGIGRSVCKLTIWRRKESEGDGGGRRVKGMEEKGGRAEG
jgi:hypothetical protein